MRQHLTPQPALMEPADGWLDLSAGARLEDHTDGRALAVAGPWLAAAWGGAYLGAPVTIRQVAALAREHYRLQVSPSGVVLEGGGHAGVLYGLCTLARVLLTRPHHGRLRAMVITDGPVTEVRGLCLDVGRRYCEPATLRQIIDQMAWVGLNRLQLHLTEWNGWRLALEDPRFASIASPQSYPAALVRQLIAYARERAIRVTVELNLPAHATALITAVPLLRPGPGDCAMSDGVTWTGTHTDGWMVDVASPAARALVRDLIVQCVAEVPADAYHLGGDEWHSEDELAQVPTLAAAAARLGRAGSAQPADVVVDFMNGLARPLLDAGHPVEMWSWPAFFAPQRRINLDRRITMTAWDADTAAIAAIVAAGHRVIASPELTHYVTPRTAPGNLDGINFVPALTARLWAAPLPSQLGGAPLRGAGTVSPGVAGVAGVPGVPGVPGVADVPGVPGVVGEQLCVWADWAEDQPDDYFTWYSGRALSVLAERLWGHATGTVDDVVLAADACAPPGPAPAPLLAPGPARGVAPGRVPGVAHDRGSGASPEPGSGVSPEPGSGVSPEPGSGASPEPGSGMAPAVPPGPGAVSVAAPGPLSSSLTAPAGESVPLRCQRAVSGGVGNFTRPSYVLAVRIRPHLTAKLGAGGQVRSDMLGLDEWRGVAVEVRSAAAWERVVTLNRQLTDTWNRIDLRLAGIIAVRLTSPRGGELPPGEVEWLVGEPPSPKGDT